MYLEYIKGKTVDIVSLLLILKKEFRNIQLYLQQKVKRAMHLLKRYLGLKGIIKK